MRVRLGTSGFGYAEWAGKFYPEGLPASERLAFYARRFDATEVNQSFYQMPRPAVLSSWAARVPEGFSFSFKAPGRVTHVKRLRDAEDEVQRLLEVTAALGPRRGVLVFQLPPGFHKDLERLESFLALLSRRARAAFEFRHRSWFAEDTLALLRRWDAALCYNDADVQGCPVAATAPFGVLKLRRVEYRDEELSELARRLERQPWEEAFVFFKHEETASGPRLAERLRAALALRPRESHNRVHEAPSPAPASLRPGVGVQRPHSGRRRGHDRRPHRPQGARPRRLQEAPRRARRREDHAADRLS